MLPRRSRAEDPPGVLDDELVCNDVRDVCACEAKQEGWFAIRGKINTDGDPGVPTGKVIFVATGGPSSPLKRINNTKKNNNVHSEPGNFQVS